MWCILCRQKWYTEPETNIAPASYTVFGLGVCALHADSLTAALIDGASVREILRQARAGV